MAWETRKHTPSLSHELREFIGSFYLNMFVRGPTTREYYQVCSWHITNDFNIHDLKSQLKYLHFQEQVSFLKNTAYIIPRVLLQSAN